MNWMIDYMMLFAFTIWIVYEVWKNNRWKF